MKKVFGKVSPTHITCIDAHYYPGVKAFLNIIPSHIEIYCVSNAYPQMIHDYQ